jgi:hypothetical protein
MWLNDSSIVTRSGAVGNPKIVHSSNAAIQIAKTPVSAPASL